MTLGLPDSRTDKLLIFVFISFLLFICDILIFFGHTSKNETLLTKNIIKYYSSVHQKVDPKIVKEVVELSYTLTPKHFPNGPFYPKDTIALAMIETDFNPYIVGKYGEIGVWQILSPEGNAFSLEGNCKAALDTLKEKYDIFGNYKMAIIGYNGISVNKKGNLYTGYWARFAKSRALIEQMDR